MGQYSRAALIRKIKDWTIGGVNSTSLNRLVLFFRVKKQTEAVQTWNLDVQPRLEFNYLINMIDKFVQDDGADVGGTQRYVLKAYYGDDELASQRWPFDIYHAPAEDGDEDTPEENERGFSGRLMKFWEIDKRTSIVERSDLWNKMRAELQDKTDENRQLRAEIRETAQEIRAERQRNWETQQTLADRTADREIEKHDKIAKIEMRKDFFEKFQMFVPIVLSKFGGPTPNGVLSPEIAAGLKMFMEGLTFEQFKGMIAGGKLDPMQSMMITGAMQQLLPPKPEPVDEAKEKAELERLMAKYKKEEPKKEEA